MDKTPIDNNNSPTNRPNIRIRINPRKRPPPEEANTKVKKTKKPKLSEKALQERREKTKERTRRYRKRLSEEALEKKREYDRKYKAKKKQDGVWKTRADMSERERRKVRKQTLERVRKCRARKEELKRREEEENNNVITSRAPTSSSKKRGRKSKVLTRTKVYKDLQTTQHKLKAAQRLAAKYKKRLQRINQCDNNTSPSPSKRVKILANRRKVPTPVKRRLVYLECISKNLEKKKVELLKENNPHKVKEFNKIVCSPDLKKKKMIKEAKTLVSYKEYRTGTKASEPLKHKRTMVKETVIKVKKFYCEDINSKMMPGKRDCITRNKVRRQKRLLLSSIKNLHKLFSAKYPSNKISLNKFRLLKPFWVVFPKLSDRETCACQLCSNVKLLYNKAYSYNIIRQPLNTLITTTVCKNENKSCMLNTCRRCKQKTFVYHLEKDEENDELNYQEWKSTEHELENKDKIIRITKKVVVPCTKKSLLEKLIVKLKLYKSHTFKISHQYKTMTDLKSQLNDDECIIHLDFSENYLCQSYEEVQSCHFGGSKRQLSLQTVVVYGRNLIKSMCTVCEDTDHKSYAIWAHLEPVLNYIRQNLPIVRTIHFKSDGPSSQYKNKFNLYFVSQVGRFFPEIENVTWNFSVAGHGKGPADGIGGVVKRTADSKIAHGNDIADGQSFINVLKGENLKVILELIPNEKIKEFKLLCPRHEDLNTIKGIKKVLQVCWTNKQPNKLSLRTLSCFSCEYDSTCEHHYFGTHIFTKNSQLKQNKIKKPSHEHPKIVESVNLLQVGSWIAVIYDDKWYPGIVEGIENDEKLKVNFMEWVGKDTLVWPTVPDRQEVYKAGVFTSIEPPFPISNRHFSIPQLEEINKKYEQI